MAITGGQRRKEKEEGASEIQTSAEQPGAGMSCPEEFAVAKIVQKHTVKTSKSKIPPRTAMH